MSARRSRRRRRRWAQIAAILLAAPLGATVVLVLPWRWIDPGTTSFIVRARAQGYPVRLQWVAWQDLSPHLPIAVIAAEDQGFLHHRGFDVESIRAALREGRRQSRGASTISQQVVKNLYLWPGRSWVRKALEAYLTLFVERLWSKRRILEIYLNIAEFGPGVFGVGTASREYFGKPASHLSAREAALLAAVLPSPKRMSVREPSSYVEQRAEWILRQMRQLGGPSHLRSP